MQGKPLKSNALAAVALLAGMAPGLASAELNLVDTEPFRLDLGAYVSSFSGYQLLGYDTAGLVPESTGANAAVLRFEWKANIGRDVSVDIQNRFFWQLTPGSELGFGGLGLGATVPPERTLDLQSTIVDENGAYFEHDLDRAAVNIFSPVADITIGRQAVTWGKSNLFTVGDLWTQFSPFELDTSQKRGVDALRTLSYPGNGVEFEAIVVDRGELEDLSGGVRVGWTLGRGDYYGAIAKNYDRVWGLMGFAADLDTVRGHAELALPLEYQAGPDEDEVKLTEPRATIGADWFASGSFTALVEYHFNGPGTTEPGEYVAQFSSAPVTRGERYFVGKHYGGTALNYLLFDDTLTLSLAALSNLVDPSALLTPSIAYSISQNVTGTLGAYVGLGEYPEFDATATTPSEIVALNSEYGLYGNFFFMQLAGYF
jgi:hypothetical protein